MSPAFFSGWDVSLIQFSCTLDIVTCLLVFSFYCVVYSFAPLSFLLANPHSGHPSLPASIGFSPDFAMPYYFDPLGDEVEPCSPPTLPRFLIPFHHKAFAKALKGFSPL